ncbi:MAG: mechanosensitive ion channel family protein [Dehalococcoidia bacterium]|nr:mechanosensitive ion channel family protein [Dehalococcoidia bacterium]
MFLAATVDVTRADAGQWFRDHGPAVFGALFLALVGAAIVRRIVRVALAPTIARQMAGRDPAEIRRRTDTLAGVIERTAQVVFMLWALFTILPEFGFNIGPALTGVGITGIALGFGAQTLVRDALNGLFILGENQYARGDVVAIAGVTGTVEDVTLRRTLLRDVDGVVYSVPNSAVIVAANYTRDFAKVRVSVPVVVTSDIDHVRAVVDDVGRQLALDPLYQGIVVTAPAYLRVETIDANGLAVQVTGTVRPGSQWEVAGVLRARLIAAFQREGIRTPWG